MRGIALLTKVHDALWRVDTPAGYIAGGTMHYYIRDHQGNVRQVTDADGNVEQDNHYYPYGMMMGESGDILDMARPGSTTKQSDANPYLYGGKEYMTTAGANLLDFTARTYDPTILMFHTPDPLRDKYLPVHSYLYCGANPVNRIDPTGCGDFWDGGKLLGGDGKKDGKVYVLKTTQSEFVDHDLNITSPGAGLDKSAHKETKNFIKNNKGNSDAFTDGCIAYTNSVEIEGSRSVRQKMADIVSADDGEGSTKPSNNREYGGYIEGGEVHEAEAGPVCDPAKDTHAVIKIDNHGNPTFHSHPSRGRARLPDNDRFASSTMGASDKDPYRFLQFPSETDIRQAGSTINYVFGRGDDKVYIYDSSGILGVVTMSRFTK